MQSHLSISKYCSHSTVINMIFKHVHIAYCYPQCFAITQHVHVLVVYPLDVNSAVSPFHIQVLQSFNCHQYDFQTCTHSILLCIHELMLHSTISTDQQNRIHPLQELHSQRCETGQLSDGAGQEGQPGIHYRLWFGQEVPGRSHTPAHPLPGKQEPHRDSQIR